MRSMRDMGLLCVLTAHSKAYFAGHETLLITRLYFCCAVSVSTSIENFIFGCSHEHVKYSKMSQELQQAIGTAPAPGTGLRAAWGKGNLCEPLKHKRSNARSLIYFLSKNDSMRTNSRPTKATSKIASSQPTGLQAAEMTEPLSSHETLPSAVAAGPTTLSAAGVASSKAVSIQARQSRCGMQLC